MKVLTLVSKKLGYCDPSPMRDMQQDVKETCVEVKKFRIINLEEAPSGSGKKVYKFDTNLMTGRTFTYTKGQYVNLTTLVIASIGVVAVSVFAYKKFKK